MQKDDAAPLFCRSPNRVGNTNHEFSLGELVVPEGDQPGTTCRILYGE
jgi:hypothetical protein